MCFKKSSSSASSSQSSSQEDNRIGAEGGSVVLSVGGENSAGSLAVNNYDTSSEVVRDALGFTETATGEVFDFASGIFAAAIETVQDGNERATQFVSETQAQFADARETDVKQLLEQLVKLAAIGAAGFVAYRWAS